jgi:hypothetical protein
LVPWRAEPRRRDEQPEEDLVTEGIKTVVYPTTDPDGNVLGLLQDR